MNRFTALLTFFIPMVAGGQTATTANDAVPPFTGQFGYGSNMGYYQPYYYDKELAALAHGTPDGAVPGVGVTTIRPGLFDYFLDFWGFDIRKTEFRFYDSIGIRDVAVIIGFPSENNRDPVQYCPGAPSESFKGLYEPIWDNGANGTPVNENNTYARYVWKMVNVYKDYVRYWEVFNEPDIDLSGNGWAPSGYPGSWFDNPPGPCETRMRMPIYHYVRMLRISYEIIKTLDPQDFVCVGGLGNPSYLDAICRFTDNPDGGGITPQYPLKGGAYFDCMDFHSYPHIDNSMRFWDNSIGGFRYTRHSDAAVDGVWRLKDRFKEVLENHGYDGITYPKKRYICTEFNIPRKAYGDYIGSVEAQNNFMIKALVTAQMEEVDQMYIYNLSDEKPEAIADNEYSYMGLFKNLENVQFPNGEANPVAYAFKTTSDLLRGSTFDPARTAAMALPQKVRGGAFRDAQNNYVYVLWAATDKDMDETAGATYSFPASFQIQDLEKKTWSFSETGAKSVVAAANIALTGSPVFLSPSTGGGVVDPPDPPVVTTIPTANDTVIPYDGPFGYGSNMGYFPPNYTDMNLAALAHGTPDGAAPGVGVTTIRPGLFGFFLGTWGYNIRVTEFQYYNNIGLVDQAVIAGFPSDADRDPTSYCPGGPGESFQGLYEPIWDNGENGTPVNENNKFALYMYKAVDTYKDYVRFWEVCNEPDFDMTSTGWLPQGEPGNWWDNPPGPCDTKMRMPVYFYVRMLRISWEIIKTLDPQDYVCIGGLGYPSYLDAVCRYSDNPNGGAISADFPLKGGAYFDCMDFHSYPHIDGSLREWDNSIGGFRFYRHSDKAVDGVFKLRDRFRDVLKKYGYNGATYPEKTWICTEFNVPRKEYGDYLGSETAQNNFMIKALVMAQKEGVDQMHVYSLADEKPEPQALSEFSFMGLFKNLDGFTFPNAVYNSVAYAYKTTSDLLRDSRFNANLTSQLQLPANVRGAAFDDGHGKTTYVLWAVTDKDRDETAAATYTFPAGTPFQQVLKMEWNFSQSGQTSTISTQNIALTGSPVFLVTQTATSAPVVAETFLKPKVQPNPVVAGQTLLTFELPEDGSVSIDLFDAMGKRMQVVSNAVWSARGIHTYPLDLGAHAPGCYFIRVSTARGIATVPVVTVE